MLYASPQRVFQRQVSAWIRSQIGDGTKIYGSASYLPDTHVVLVEAFETGPVSLGDNVWSRGCNTCSSRTWSSVAELPEGLKPDFSFLVSADYKKKLYAEGTFCSVRWVGTAMEWSKKESLCVNSHKEVLVYELVDL